MRPNRFQYHNPASLDSAFELFAKFADNAMYFAGGTEAMIVLKERVVFFEHIINLKKIPCLNRVDLHDASLEIGALATHHQLATDAMVQQHLPGYARLSNNIANIRVRETGTLGGNLAFGEPHADPPAMLAALRAKVVLASPKGRREVAVEDFLVGDFETDLEDSEVLVSIKIPLGAGTRRAWYQKFVHLYRPSAGVAAVRSEAAGASSWEVWAGTLTGRPERLNYVAELLDSHCMAGIDAIQAAAHKDLERLDVPDGNYGSGEYRKHLSAVLASRVVEECRK